MAQAAPGWQFQTLAAFESGPQQAEGASVDRQVLDAAEVLQLVKSHASVLVPENALQWEVVHPSSEVRDLSEFSALEARFASSGMRFHGYPLVWHEQLPAWLAMAPPETLREYLRQHISCLVGVHRGRIDSWDVVTEPMVHDCQWLRASLKLTTLGPGSIAQALRWAHAVDLDV